MSVQTIVAPDGTILAVLPLVEYEAMRDALEAHAHSRALLAIARGELGMLTEEELKTAQAAVTGIAFWRKKRKMTQKALGAAVGISQNYVAELERGNRRGDPLLFLRIAKALKVRMEDLVIA